MIRAKEREIGASEVLGELDFFANKSKNVLNASEDGKGANECLYSQTEAKGYLELHHEDEANKSAEVQMEGAAKKRKGGGRSTERQKKKTKTPGKEGGSFVCK